MTSTPRALCALLAAAVALALAACDGAEPAAGNAQASAGEGAAEYAALIRQAREAVEDGDLADAGRLLERARALDPGNPAALVDIARLKFRRGEHVVALAAAERALELGPEYAPALLLRAQLVRDAHGLTPSLAWFEAAVAADPADPVALAEYAATLGDAGEHSRMLAVTRALTKIEPKSPRALYLKAVLAARGQQPVLAKSLLERSGLVAQGQPSAMLLDALIDLADRRHDSAAETLAALAERQPGNVRVSELLARALWLGGRDAQLVERFGDAAREPSASPYLVMLVGRALERQGERERAAPYLERAYAGRAEGWTVLPGAARLPDATARMRALIAGRDLSGARLHAGSLQTRFPESADIAALSGDAALAGGDFAGALELYRKATLVRRPWPLTRKAAAAYRGLGDPLAADVLIARHLAGEPRNTEALLLYAERAAAQEDWLRVAVLLDNAIGLGAGNDPRLLKLRSIAARALGDIEGARRFERMTWDLHPAILPSG